MKKILTFGILATIVFIFSAGAYSQSDKDRCLKGSGKVVWIESKGACIPLNPCIDKTRYGAYCNDYMVLNRANRYKLHKVVNAYAVKNLDSRGCKEFITNDSQLAKTVVIGCLTYNDNYIAFNLSDQGDDESTYLNPLCKIYGGTPEVKGEGFVCNGISTVACSDFDSLYDSEMGNWAYVESIPACELTK